MVNLLIIKVNITLYYIDLPTSSIAAAMITIAVLTIVVIVTVAACIVVRTKRKRRFGTYYM